MKGLELSEQFYKEYGEPMLRENFPELLPFLAAGLFGSGSECLGYDDETSEDHDFEPGFCIILPGEDVVDRKQAFQLERAYMKLPQEYLGYKRPKMLPVGGARRGVIRMADFFSEHTGYETGDPDPYDYLHLPEQSLLEATNGKVFFDNYGEFTRIRRNLSYFPEDIRLKKLSGQLLLMEQAGQYNYPRILKHKETAAAQLALNEFVKASLSVVYLLNKRYQPYYKWVFRGFRDLQVLTELKEDLEVLLMTDNEPETAEIKMDIIEKICQNVRNELSRQGLLDLSRTSHGIGPLNPLKMERPNSQVPDEKEEEGENNADLERIAYQVNDMITDPDIRNLHILAGV